MKPFVVDGVVSHDGANSQWSKNIVSCFWGDRVLQQDGPEADGERKAEKREKLEFLQ